ncbi:hypothetical protein [Acidithiobacillus sp.]|uniref:hypothetical protein n=1 Tax=Acidithiobacillus sp. TaxID=1872118 RepID=UPI002634A3C9|nr:hypothetical protein [Acidithiobacillus sp.]MDD5278658.1 hypothetical protein [Acidithiobacillus sp.]
MLWKRGKKNQPIQNEDGSIDAILIDEDDDLVDGSGKIDSTPKSRPKQKSAGPSEIYIAAELSSGQVDVWRITRESSEIINVDDIPANAVILRFTGNDLSTSKKGKNAKVLKNELRVILNDNPVIKSHINIAYATTKSELIRFENRQAPGICVLLSVQKMPGGDRIIGIYAEGMDSIAVAAYIDETGEIKGYAVSTDASESGREEVSRRARLLIDGDVGDLPAVWVKASSLSLPSKKLLSFAYPIEGELAGKPATYWGGIGIAAGVVLVVISGGLLVSANSQLASAKSAMQVAMQGQGKGEQEIKTLFKKHVHYVESKNSVNLTKGIVAASTLWQPGELATLSMSSNGAPSGRSNPDKTPSNGITILVTPFISADGSVQNDTQWLPPKLLMSKIEKAAPHGYRIDAVHMDPSGQKYEVVYEADKH